MQAAGTGGRGSCRRGPRGSWLGSISNGYSRSSSGGGKAQAGSVVPRQSRSPGVPGTPHLRASSLGRALSLSSGSPLLFPNRCCLPRASCAGRGPSSFPIYPMMSPIPVAPDITGDITSPSPRPWCSSGAGQGRTARYWPAVSWPTKQLEVLLSVALRSLWQTQDSGSQAAQPPGTFPVSPRG